MRKQTYLIRKGARYHFRRRLPSKGTDNGALTLSLHTADPDEARRLARRLAVRWDEIAMLEGQKINRGNLNGAELQAIFRAGLEEELLIAVRDLAAPRKFQEADLGFGEIFIAAYTAILQVRADADHVPPEVIDAVAKGWSQTDRAALETMLAVFVPPDDIKETRIVAALQQVGAPVCGDTIHEARASLLRGMIEAQRRAALFHHPLMQARGDAVAGLLDDNLVFEARRSQLPHLAYPSNQTFGEQTQVLSASEGNLFFARVTKVRFSEQIDQLHDNLFTDRGWQPDDGKTKHMLEAFAWLTGDKAMSEYEPSDIDVYVRRMALIPAKFRWGHLHKSGPMAEPFDLSAFPKPKAGERRSDRTINSHLSKLASAAKILKKTHWLPRQGFGNVMDFEDARKSIVQDDNDPPRMPLTEENLKVLYGLSLWQGGGGSLQRLKEVPRPKIYQDAAYWVPLLGTYAGMSREEACGLEQIDLGLDAKTPYVLVQANMTKSKDGETPGGLKRSSRKRALPLHPELLRLGFARYCEAVGAEGWTMLFPELYGELKDEGEFVRWTKAGGPKFYSVAWRPIIDAAHAILPLPKTSGGKHADFHSQRTFHYSAMAAEDVSEALLARHVGHSQRTTGGRNYNRRALAMGLENELAERRVVLVREVPDVTGHVPAPDHANLLHVNKRSRVGSAKGRNASTRFLA
jgi:integrase